MNSRVASPPSGSRTVSRLTCSSLPQNTSSEAINVSHKCTSSSGLVMDGLVRFAVARSVSCGGRAHRCPSGSGEPIAPDKKVGIELRFGTVGLGLPVVAPFHERRERHQNGLGAPVRLQTKQRPPVVHQVEFDVSTAPISLEIALPFAVRQILAPEQNRFIGGEKMISDAAGKRETVFEVRIVQIVVEDATDTTRFAPMLEIEVFVAPAFEARVVIGTQRRKGIAAGRVKVDCVFDVTIVGG